MKIIPSPNYDERPNCKIDCLVLHYTDMENAVVAIKRLKSLESRVSAHYVVDEYGLVIRMVEEKYRAWHAGESSWRGIRKVNDFSIGIEMVNPGHTCGYRSFPEEQIRAVAELSREIMARHKIPQRNVVGHSDIAPGRKKDPGEMFDWQFLAELGVGLWHERKYHRERLLLQKGDRGGEVCKIQKSLANYGYRVSPTSEFDEETRMAVIAFQMHFLPLNSEGTRDLTGVWTQLEQEILEDLLLRM